MPRNVLTLVAANPGIGGEGITVPRMSPYLVVTVTHAASSRNVNRVTTEINRRETKLLHFIFKPFKASTKQLNFS